MDDFFFSPRRAQIPVGSQVAWKNNGALIHTATEIKSAWNTGDVAPGETKSVTFDTPGTYTYNCSPHPWMIGQVIVQ
jgi:plastocyanin